jgi:hypothetical protein
MGIICFISSAAPMSCPSLALQASINVPNVSITPAIVVAYALLRGDIGGLIDKVHQIFGG